MENFDKTAFAQKVKPLVMEKQFDKVAEAIRPYVRMRLYEESFADRLLAVRTVQENDLQVEVKDDSYYVVSNIEQNTRRAVVANFFDRPVEDYITGKRYKIPLGLHKTRQARKNVRELMAYDYDILSDAADKDVYELGNLRDWKLLLMLNRCIERSGKRQADIVDPSTAGPVQINKVHFNRLGSTLNTGGRTGMPAEDRLQVKKYLTHRELMEDIALLDADTFGDDLTSETFEDGALDVISTIMGHEYIASIKERMFTEHDHVTVLSVDDVDDATVDTTYTAFGSNFSVGTTADATTATEAVRDHINSNEELEGVSAEVVGGDLRVRVEAEPDDRERAFLAYSPQLQLGNVSTSGQSTGYDRFDVMWAFPEPQFLGELIRLGGTEVETEMWRTKGEEMVNRVSREWFGMGIGNFNGVAKMRLQRSRHGVV